VPEEGTTNSEELNHQLEARFFAVGTAPYCVWDWDLHERNLEYLESLDPDYFDYVGRANLPHLDSEDPKERRRVATAIRTAYHHGLESFFGLLFATLQAPRCVAGWMQAYVPADLTTRRPAGGSGSSPRPPTTRERGARPAFLGPRTTDALRELRRNPRGHEDRPVEDRGRAEVRPVRRVLLAPLRLAVSLPWTGALLQPLLGVRLLVQRAGVG
jgi:hypothetical protein